MTEYNKEKRLWYFKNFSKEETETLRSLYYKEMEDSEINIYFFDWFEEYCIKNTINYPFWKNVNPVTKINTTWKTPDNNTITCAGCLGQSINMLTQDQTMSLISIIDKMEDSPLRDEFLQQLNLLVKKEETLKKDINPPINSMNEIFNRFRPKPTITLSDLQEEVKILKEEVNQLKQNDLSQYIAFE